MPPSTSVVDHHPGVEQVGLDEAVGQRADDHRRQEGDQDVAHEAELVAVVQQAGGGAREAAEIVPAHRPDRAELDDHLEHLAGRALEADQVDHEDQMPGRGHRQELGQALDDAEQQRPEQELQIHRLSFWLHGVERTQGAGLWRS